MPGVAPGLQALHKREKSPNTGALMLIRVRIKGL